MKELIPTQILLLFSRLFCVKIIEKNIQRRYTEPEEIPIIHARKTVLIADDIEMNREIMGDLLQEDYNILYASDGVETLEVLHSHKCKY